MSSPRPRNDCVRLFAGSSCISQSTPLLVFFLLAAGFAWTSTTATFNVTVQLSVPGWVQARALGAYQTVFWAGMAFGELALGIYRGARFHHEIAAGGIGGDAADAALHTGLPFVARHAAGSQPISAQTVQVHKWRSSPAMKMDPCW